MTKTVPHTLNVGDRVRIFIRWDYTSYDQGYTPKKIMKEGTITGYIYWSFGTPVVKPCYIITDDNGVDYERSDVEEVLS